MLISQTDVIDVMQDAIRTVILTSMPMLLIGMVVGLIVSIFQATTQINEQTLAFVPKIVAILLAILLFSGFMLDNLSEFFIRTIERVGLIIR